MTIVLRTHTKRKLEPINKNSSLGEQIKYYRMLEDIKQKDLGLKLNFHKSSLNYLENRKAKLCNINLIKSILEELNIKDKVYINDEYIEFLLNNPSDKIKKTRNSLNMSRQEFADFIGVSVTSIKRWENGSSHISRTKYAKLKESIR